MPTPSRSSFPMTGRELRPTCSNASANPISRAGAMGSRSRVRAAVSVLAFLSPVPCLSARVQRSLSATVFFRTTAPWFRSPGHEAVSRRTNRPRNRPSGSGPAGRPDRPYAVLAAPAATPYVAMSDIEDTRIVSAIAELTRHADRSLLIVEDDKPFLERLARAMEARGFTVTACDSVAEGLAQIGR